MVYLMICLMILIFNDLLDDLFNDLCQHIAYAFFGNNTFAKDNTG
jgi:hypothetical protein